jgi:putative transposase
MFQDEAGFGRITDPAGCWAPPRNRPTVPSQRIRQYKTMYGAVSPVDGERLFLVLDKSNSENMNQFLKVLSEKFSTDTILLCVDNASWHTSNELFVPENICLFHILPRTPEMNPIEIVWREIRKIGFKNKVFTSIGSVIEKFREVVDGMSNEKIRSITLWDWIAHITLI